jgi:hypothetical protein
MAQSIQRYKKPWNQLRGDFFLTVCVREAGRWGGDGEAVQLGKYQGVGNCLRLPQNPQRQMHALLGAF